MADLDPDLVRLVDGLPRVPFDGVAYRHLGPRIHPLSGEGARIRGGRWNPPESFPVLYLGSSVEAVAAEFLRLAERQGMPPENLLPRALQRYSVEFASLLDVRPADVRELLGLTPVALTGFDATMCQAVGDAAHYAEFEGIMAPSATGHGEAIALFMDRLGAGSVVTPGRSTIWHEVPAT